MGNVHQCVKCGKEYKTSGHWANEKMCEECFQSGRKTVADGKSDPHVARVVLFFVVTLLGLALIVLILGILGPMFPEFFY